MSEHLKFTYLEEGIYRFRWLNRSEAAGTEFYSLITRLYDELPQDTKVIRILHDYRHVSSLPLFEVTSRIQSLQGKYPNLNRRIAYLSDYNLIEPLIVSLAIVSKRSGTRRFFESSQEREAIDWLLEDN